MLVLEGESVRLEPLQERHLEALCEIALDPDITRFLPHRFVDRGELHSFIRDAVRARESRTAIPFAIVLTHQGGSRVVGTTRFLNIDAKNGRMEIGGTMIGRPWQRTRVNTEVKYLMLRHAFEAFACIRVEFKTDSLNERSRRALLRIGAVPEGVFRNHVITGDGRIRHSAYYSITAEEWPAVKVRLSGMLAGTHAAAHHRPR